MCSAAKNGPKLRTVFYSLRLEPYGFAINALAWLSSRVTPLHPSATMLTHCYPNGRIFAKKN